MGWKNYFMLLGSNFFGLKKESLEGAHFLFHTQTKSYICQDQTNHKNHVFGKV